MTNESVLTNPASQQCQFRFPSGRHCRMLSQHGALFCTRHTTAQNRADAQAAVAARLIGDAGEFRSAVEINRSLGELYKLLARDEIAPRRAAVMAYTCNLLLRTLPAIEHELAYPASESDPQRIIIDMPGPTRE